MQLEEMAAFFAARVEGYDQHMFANIDGAPEFYPATAALLRECHCILDLGCGTGLEIGEIFIQNPTARITGIDLSPAMLAALSEKFAARKTQLTLLQGDYFSLPFGEAQFDGAVSVESLHHFTYEEKLGLYQSSLPLSPQAASMWRPTIWPPTRLMKTSTSPKPAVCGPPKAWSPALSTMTPPVPWKTKLSFCAAPALPL